MRRFWLLILLLVAAPASAHPVPYSYLDLRLDEGAIQASLVVHRQDVAHELGQDAERLLDRDFLAKQAGAIRALIESRVQLSVDGSPIRIGWSAAELLPERDALRLESRVPVQKPGRVALAMALFPYDSAHQTFVNLYESGQLENQAILDRDHARLDYFTGSRQGVMAVAAKFIPGGVWHILLGVDHVAFLIGLLLLGGTRRKLILLASAFTLAHSITLSLAALDVWSPSPRLIEPAIALSIICVGVDNLMARGGRDLRAWMAFGFGLIHGFGFAGVLRAMELPSYRLGGSLFFFNFGVELGQLFILLAVAPALAALRKRSHQAAERLALVGSIGVILAGTFWFVQRLVSPEPAAQNAAQRAHFGGQLAFAAPPDKK